MNFIWPGEGGGLFLFDGFSERLTLKFSFNWDIGILATVRNRRRASRAPVWANFVWRWPSQRVKSQFAIGVKRLFVVKRVDTKDTRLKCSRRLHFSLPLRIPFLLNYVSKGSIFNTSFCLCSNAIFVPPKKSQPQTVLDLDIGLRENRSRYRKCSSIPR